MSYTNDETPADTGARSQNLDEDSDRKRNSTVAPLDVGVANPSSSWPDDPRDPEDSSDAGDRSVPDVSHAEEERASATELVTKFVESVRDSGTVMPGGRIDRAVLAAAAWLTKDSEDFLEGVTIELHGARADSKEVDDWVQAVERKAQGRSIELVPAPS